MRKTNKTSFGQIAAIILLVTIMFTALIVTGQSFVVSAEEDSTQEDQTPEVEVVITPYIIEHDGITADLSRFNTVKLPVLGESEEMADKIDENNIGNYVPIEFFSTSNTVISYLGRFYGFVLEIDGGRNRVLLFRVEHSRAFDDMSEYGFKLEVVYRNAFSKTIFGIHEIAAGETVLLGVPQFITSIFDADGEVDPVTEECYNGTKGAFFVEANYDGNISLVEQKGDSVEATGNAILTVAGSYPDVMIDAFQTTNKALKVAAKSCMAADIVLSVAEIVDSYTYTAINVPNNHGRFTLPLTAEEQLNQKGVLCKSFDIIKENEENEYLDLGDSVEIFFRINNPDSGRYFVENYIKIPIKKFGGFNEPQQVDVLGAEVLYNMSEDKVECEQLSRDEEGFTLSNGYNVIPLVSNRVLKFTPPETGWYGVSQLVGYNVDIKNQQRNENGLYLLESGKPYEIIVQKEGVSLPEDDGAVQNGLSVYTAADFGGQHALSAIYIWRDQDLSLNDTALQSGLTYMPIENEVEGNNVYSIATSNTSDIEMYITDSEFNILAQGQKTDGKIVVNFPMLADEKYYLVCENEAGSAVPVTFFREGDLTIGDTDYEGVPMYYRFDVPYTQTYCVYGDCRGWYTVSGQKITNSGSVMFFQQGETYYLLSAGEESGVSLDIEFNAISAVDINDEYLCKADEHAVFSFVPDVTLRYIFSGGGCDIYDDDGMMAAECDGAVLEEGQAYTIVKTDTGGTFSIAPDATALEYGESLNAVDAAAGTAYSFILDEETRINVELSNASGFEIYNVALNPIQKDHGYLLAQGKYYIVVNEGGSYTIEVSEYLQPVTINLVVDGQPYNDASGQTYYYGKPFKLPTPQKDRYDFGGWKDGDTIVTDEDGNSFSAIYEDEITLTAHWVLRGLVMEIDMGNGDAKWWTGDSIEDAQPDAVYLEDDFIRLLIDLKDDYVAMPDGSGNKEGHFLSTFTYEKESSVGNVDYYVFEPVWVTETYALSFVLDGGYKDVYVTFGETLDDEYWDAQFFDYKCNLWYADGWNYTFNGVGYTLDVNAGMTIPDLTPGEGTTRADISFTPNQREVEYAVEINGVTYKLNSIPDGIDDEMVQYGDKFLLLGDSLSDYGMNESAYKGRLVYLTDNENNIFYFGNKITRHDLVEHYDVSNYSSVAVKLNVKNDSVTFNVSYNYSNTSNAKSFTSTGVVALKNDIELEGYLFDSWRYNGKVITELSVNALGISECYYSSSEIPTINISAIFTRTEYDFGTLQSLTVTGKASYVDCKGVSYNVSGKLTIASSVDVVTIDGMGSTWRDTSIIVASRSTELLIIISNISVMGAHSSAAIDASQCTGKLRIKSLNGVTLQAGESSEGTVAKAGITVGGSLSLEGERFYIYGGSQCLVLDELVLPATEAIAGGTYSSKLTIDAKVYAYGGNGSFAMKTADLDGTDGVGKTVDGAEGDKGHKGGDGAAAIRYNGVVEILSGAFLYCEGGDGGQGSQGGTGGKGSDGVNGSFGVFTVLPGNGGKGGDGGDGGKGGDAIIARRCDNFTAATFEGKGGEGGAGGAGGEGGEGGAGCETIWGNKKPAGDPGEKGDEGSSGPKGASTY